HLTARAGYCHYLHVGLGLQQVSNGIPHYLMMVGKDKCQSLTHVLVLACPVASPPRAPQACSPLGCAQPRAGSLPKMTVLGGDLRTLERTGIFSFRLSPVL